MADYLIIYIIAAPFIVLLFAGYWKLFQKAGRHGWEALIPIYSHYLILKLSGRPTWWLIWMFVPVVNVVVSVGIYISFIKSYGKFILREQLAGVLLAFIYLPKWGFDHNVQYLGPSASSGFIKAFPKSSKKSTLREWAEIIVVAFGVLIFIRTFFIEAYVIPTPSMERTLLVGDNIFVSKINYGPRIPMTPFSFPFANHTIPQFNIKSYWDGIKIPYYRLPGLSEIKKGDIVVFNYPMDADSPLYRPVDKRENYIKRCEGAPGDTLSIVDGQVFVNHTAMSNPPGEQIDYSFTVKGTDINPEVFNALHISLYEGNINPTMTKESANIFRGYSNIKSLTPHIALRGITDSNYPVYPTNPVHPVGPPNLMLNGRAPDYKWNVDNYGPVIIPKKGWTVKLDSMTYPIYIRCITVYEGNKVTVRGDDIFINNKKANSYTFRMNYYWMMGDNRHDSDDSRFWGFLPEDHIIGKALFVGLSTDADAPLFSRIRWDRLFKSIR